MGLSLETKAGLSFIDGCCRGRDGLAKHGGDQICSGCQGLAFRVQGFEGKGAGDQGLEVRVEGFMGLGF